MGCNGETATVEVESLCSWEISASEDWVHTSVENGISGKTSFTISADENKTVSKRTAIIAIANSNAAISRSITVHQGSGAPFITSDVDKVEFSADASTKSIKINSNIDNTITSSQSWCKVNKSNGTSGETTLEISVEASPVVEKRSATITFANSKYNYSSTITVSQEKFVPEMAVSVSELTTYDIGETKSVTVTSNISWKATCSADWITLSPTNSEKGENVLKITTATNTTTSTRTATVTVSNTEYNISKEIKVTQAESVPTVIFYTSRNGETITPHNIGAFGANIVSNTYNDGLGVILFDAPVTLIGERAFYNRSGLTSITIPNSVTSIGNYAFYISGLTSVTIPNSVTSIGYDAFSSCSSLTSVTIPNSVTSIGVYAFENCRNLTSVTIGNSVTKIGHAAFSYCSSLKSITIPNSVTSIGASAFSYCSSLTSVSIGNSVTSIGTAAFSGCSSLTSVTIPNSVTSIGEKAFSYCSSLTSITIPNSVTEIGSVPFTGCSSLKCFYGKFASSDNRCLIVDGVLNSFAPAGLTSYTIPNSVTSIGYEAFRNCSSLTSVTIPNSITSIGYEAFGQCRSLTSITIPDSVTSIGVYAFSYCSSLRSITIPNSVTSIGASAFSYCSRLTSVYCKPTTPPAGGVNIFDNNASGRMIYVPTTSVDAYKSAEYWSNYDSSIVGYDFD